MVKLHYFIVGMLYRACRKWTIHAVNLIRNYDHNARRNNYRFIDFIQTPPSLLVSRRLSSVSKVVFDAKSKNINEQPTDIKEEVSPLHDLELQNFLEEIKGDFGEQPVKKKPTITGKKEGKKEDSDSDETKPYKLSTEELANLPLSIKEKFVQYRDEDSNIIRSTEEKPHKVLSWKQRVIEVEEEEEQYLYQKKYDKLDYVSLERGKRGVFDIEQLVCILKQENLYNIAVIQIPPSLHYCDYLLLATAKSPRHLVASADFIRRLHKKKKHCKEPVLIIEGEKCRDWKAIDMGHVVLHLFLSEARELYDIETLWTIGETYDPLSNQKPDPYEDLLKEHMEFLKNADRKSVV